MTPTKPARAERVDIEAYRAYAPTMKAHVEPRMLAILADLEATRAESVAWEHRAGLLRNALDDGADREAAQRHENATLRAECERLRVELADIDTRERDARGWDLARDNADAQRWRAVERELRSLRCIHDGIKPGCFVCELVAAYRAATDGGGE